MTGAPDALHVARANRPIGPPQNDHPIVRGHPARRAPHAVIGHRQRLDQGRLFVADVIGDLEQALLFGQGVLGHAARVLPRKAVQLQIGAHVGVQAVLAVGADVALDRHLGHHPVTRPKASDIPANLHHLARPLVAGNEGKGPFRIAALPHVDVGATQAGGLDADQHLVGARDGIGDIFQAQVAHAAQDGCFHASSPRPRPGSPPGRPGHRRLLAAHHEHSARPAVQHLFGHAAIGPSLDTGQAVARHDDQVNTARLGIVQDLAGHARFPGPHLHRHPLVGQRGAQGGQVILGLAHSRGHDVVIDVRHLGQGLGARDGLRDAEQHQPRRPCRARSTGPDPMPSRQTRNRPAGPLSWRIGT